MNNSYKDERMNLNDVCKWLTNKGYDSVAEVMLDDFTYHTWTVNGLLRKDVIKEIFEKEFGTNDLFRAMECDVVKIGRAHV